MSKSNKSSKGQSIVKRWNSSSNNGFKVVKSNKSGKKK